MCVCAYKCVTGACDNVAFEKCKKFQDDPQPLWHIHVEMKNYRRFYDGK